MHLPDTLMPLIEVNTSQLSAEISKIKPGHTSFFACTEYGQTVEVMVTIFSHLDEEGHIGLLKIRPPAPEFFAGDYIRHESIARVANLTFEIHQVPDITRRSLSGEQQIAIEKKLLSQLLLGQAAQ